MRNALTSLLCAGLLLAGTGVRPAAAQSWAPGFVGTPWCTTAWSAPTSCLRGDPQPEKGGETTAPFRVPRAPAAAAARENLR